MCIKFDLLLLFTHVVAVDSTLGLSLHGFRTACGLVDFLGILFLGLGVKSRGMSWTMGHQRHTHA